MRERQIEQRLTQAVRKRQGLCPKWVSPGLDGVPDRIIITPSCNPAWQDELLRLQELSDGRVFLLTPDDLHEQSNDGDKEGKTA